MTTTCAECGAARPAERYFCDECGAFAGTPCAGCGRKLELHEALCKCGVVTEKSEKVLKAMMRRRFGSEDADELLLSALLGLTAAVVRSRLGKPDISRRGLRTPGRDDPSSLCPWPTTLVGGRSYEEWCYDRGDVRWVLWLSRDPGGRMRPRSQAIVVQVTEYPVNATF